MEYIGKIRPVLPDDDVAIFDHAPETLESITICVEKENSILWS